VRSGRSNLFVALAVVFAVILWGGNNAGTRHLVHAAHWPPIWTGGTRFLCAGLLLFGVLRLTRWFGEPHHISRDASRQLWLRGGLSLAAYIVCFNWSLRYTSACHVALYLGAAPVWALLWEGHPANARLAVQRYGAALLALSGVFLLLWPELRSSSVNLPGELLGLAASVLWTHYGRQCRVLTQGLSGVEVSAQTMWRAGVLLLPFAGVEVARAGIAVTPAQLGIQTYCVVAGGVAAFAIWNMALRRWPTSRVYLFNNLIPLSTATWAHYTLGETVSTHFWWAMATIITGVMIGQWNWAPSPNTP
jgi:drug/metabolite transporter (DMT)-like permease